jgi:hypothetical protein
MLEIAVRERERDIRGLAGLFCFCIACCEVKFAEIPPVIVQFVFTNVLHLCCQQLSFLITKL